MTAAPTPPPHTPIAFLSGGAGGLFSAACAAALANAGYDTADFGSYDHVDGNISDAKKKVNLFNDNKFGVPSTLPAAQQKTRQDALNDWRAANPGAARPPAPTARDKNLAGSQSGHLVMNSSYQRERENPCTSVVDGFEDNLAPCMPHSGRTSVAGLEHHWVYHHEINQPRSRGLTPEGGTFAGCTDPVAGQTPPVAPHRYSAADIDADESARIRNNPRLNSGGPSTVPAPAGAGTSGAASGAAGAGASAGVAGGGGGAAAPVWQQTIDGNNAAECVDAFRRAAMAAMRDHCAQNLKANEALATGNNPALSPAQHQANLRARIAAETAAGNTKNAAKLQRDLNRAVEANCRAAMGRRIVAGTPHNDGRCPAGSPATTHANSHGADVPVNLIGPSSYGAIS